MRHHRATGWQATGGVELDRSHLTSEVDLNVILSGHSKDEVHHRHAESSITGPCSILIRVLFEQLPQSPNERVPASARVLSRSDYPAHLDDQCAVFIDVLVTNAVLMRFSNSFGFGGSASPGLLNFRIVM